MNTGEQHAKDKTRNRMRETNKRKRLKKSGEDGNNVQW